MCHPSTPSLYLHVCLQHYTSHADGLCTKLTTPVPWCSVSVMDFQTGGIFKDNIHIGKGQFVGKLQVYSCANAVLLCSPHFTSVLNFAVYLNSRFVNYTVYVATSGEMGPMGSDVISQKTCLKLTFKTACNFFVIIK